STGRPKGVMVEQRSLSNHVCGILEHYELETSDRALHFAATSFDVSLEQILPTLAAGATLVLRDDELWTPAELIERVREHGLTVANLAPAYWHTLVAELAPGADL